MGQSWNLPGRTALATLAGLAILEGFGGPAWAAPRPAVAAPVPAKVAGSSSGLVSVDFVEADLGDVVKAISVQSGTNVVLTGAVKGKVTVRLKGTTLEEALRLITDQLDNVEFKRINSTYVVGSRDALRAWAVRSGVTQSITTKSLSPSDARDLAQGASPYIDAQVRAGELILRGLPEDVTAAREAVASADLSAGAAPSTKVISTSDLKSKLTPKALADLLQRSVPELKCSVRELGVIITGSNAQLARADDVVKTADAAGGFPKLTKLYELKYLHPSQAQKMIESTYPTVHAEPGAEALAPNPGSFKPLSIDSNKSFNSVTSVSSAGANGLGSSNGQTKARRLILSGPEDDLNAALTLLQQTDIAPPQVVIECRIVESSPEAIKNIGLQWNFGTSTIGESAGHTSVNVGQILRSPISFQATINAMVTNQHAKILAEPKIAVIDGEDASIFIGDTYRYRVLVGNFQGQQTFDVKEQPVGIVLLVRPRVNADGLVTLNVNPVVSTITSFFGPEQIPQTASREAASTIRVKDGDTVAIGGLIRDEDRQTIQKVPILGSLPLVGQLFRNNFHDHRRTDVTIFLTTHILKS